MKDTEELEHFLSDPTEQAVETLASLSGDVMVVGASGKMGPTLVRMVRRAADLARRPRHVFAVARFTAAAQEDRLRAQNIDTIRCDLLEPNQIERLPEVANILYLVGRKFGSTGQESLTWAMNCYLPGVISQKFCRSRIVALSTGNVYGLTPVAGGGSRETEGPDPQGEYAQSCLGRERIFEHFSSTLSIPIALLRLNYACELRYGVLVDLAQRVLAGLPVDLGTGYFNIIWQGDANAMAICALGHVATPPRLINITGPEQLSVRQIAEEFARLFGKAPVFQGTEASDALLNNAQLSQTLFGYPRVTVVQMMEWIADWLKRGGETLGKPTHFEVRDGRF